MSYTHYSDLTGSGILHLDELDSYGYWHTIVTDLGFSHTIELGAPLRFVDIGWICPAELDVDAGVGMLGYFFMNREWIEFEQQTFDYHTLAVNIAGFTEVGYSLRAGVIIDLYTFAP